MSRIQEAQKQARKLLGDAILEEEKDLVERIADYDTTLLGMLREVGQGVIADVATATVQQEERKQRAAGFTREERSSTFFLPSSDLSK